MHIFLFIKYQKTGFFVVKEMNQASENELLYPTLDKQRTVDTLA